MHHHVGKLDVGIQCQDEISRRQSFNLGHSESLPRCKSKTGHLKNVQFNVTCDSSPSELVMWNIYNRTWETRQESWMIPTLWREPEAVRSPLVCAGTAVANSRTQPCTICCVTCDGQNECSAVVSQASRDERKARRLLVFPALASALSGRPLGASWSPASRGAAIIAASDRGDAGAARAARARRYRAARNGYAHPCRRRRDRRGSRCAAR